MFKLSFYYNSLLLVPLAVQALELSMVADYSGTSFFDKWNFYGFYDNLTSGTLIYIDDRDRCVAILNEPRIFQEMSLG